MDNGRAHAQVHQHETYQHKKHIKQGSQRLDRRSGAGVHGQPKKSGNGGKFTWEGSALEEQNDQDIALDEKDPNYEEEEQAEENEKPSPPPSCRQGLGFDETRWIWWPIFKSAISDQKISAIRSRLVTCHFARSDGQISYCILHAYSTQM
ncbi:hypothetical protein R1flu_013198 [Riccia fluitans]|uniref:Uncharacterized protein n=1 Tax=Riccia fluitans TaxID=41844 RepID=A0ABD1YFQ9_9MARC